MDSRATKGKGYRAERQVQLWLRERMAESVSIERARPGGAKDEGDVKVVLPGGLHRYTIEVKYRGVRPGRKQLDEFRRQARVEAAFYGADRAILVTNAPRLAVSQWTVHFRPIHLKVDDPRWLTGDVENWLLWVLDPDAADNMKGMFL